MSKSEPVIVETPSAVTARQRSLRHTLATAKRGIGLLERGEGVAMVGLFVLIVAVGLVEAAVVAMVIPLVQSILDPGALATKEPFATIAAHVGLRLDENSFPILAGVMSGLVIVSAFGALAVSYIVDRQAASSRNRLGNKMIRRVLDAPYIWLAGKNSTALARQIFMDVGNWRNGFLQSLLLLCQAFVMIVLPASVAITLAPAEGMFAIIAIGAIGVTAMLTLRPLLQRFARATKTNADKTLHSLIQTISGVRDVKLSNRSSFFINQFNIFYARGNALIVYVRLISQLSPALIIVFGQLGFLYAAYLLFSSGLPGVEIAANLAMIAVVVARVVPATNSAASHFNKFVAAIPFVDGLLQLLEEVAAAEAAQRRRSGGEAAPRQWRALCLENVTLRYPGGTEPSLEDVSFTFLRGRRYGVVGRSGAGKSSLINVLLGLVPPTHGRMALDGRDFQDFDIAQWREQIGYVPQDIFLIDDTLSANIAFGERSVDSARLQAAIERAQLGDVVSALPTGVETPIGERGRRFSGGQAQRIAIARALYREPNLMILDEATSALDKMTEGAVQDAFDALGDDVLGIAIAHRVHSLRNCHEILVMEAGRIDDVGDFQQLWARNALFRELADETFAAPPR